MPTEREPEQLIEDARHKSVTKKRLTKLKGGITARYLYDKPLIDYLEEDEQPHFILASRGKAPKFTVKRLIDSPKKAGSDETPSLSSAPLQGMAMCLVTDKRLLLVGGNKDGDIEYEIPLTQLEAKNFETGGKRHKIIVETQEYEIEIYVGNMYSASEVEAVFDFLTEFGSSDVGEPPGVTAQNARREKDEAEDSEGEPKKEGQDFPVEIIDRTLSAKGRGKANTLYAKLTVPTQSSGATFSSQGWNVGGNIVRRTSSKGEIDENNWENYVKKFYIHEDHVEIGVTHGDLSMTSDNSLHEHIRLNLSDITDIRTEFGKKFVFETAEDVYQFKLARAGKLSRVSSGSARKIVTKLNKAVANAPDDNENDSPTGGSQPAQEDSPTEKLSQIKELHDQGVLTDEEFEDKKQELLDQI